MEINTHENMYGQYKRLLFDAGGHYTKMSVIGISSFLADMYFTGGGGGLNCGGISSLRKMDRKRLAGKKLTVMTHTQSDLSLTFSE